MNNSRMALRQKARLHNFEINNKYADRILASVTDTVVHSRGVTGIERSVSDNLVMITGNRKTGIVLEDSDTVYSVVRHSAEAKNLGVLNFASFKRPGGGFLDGAMAQEEALCHSSDLYSILSQMTVFYETNKSYLNRSLYVDRGLYTPGVIFERGLTRCTANVITVAAPNKAAAMCYKGVSSAENSRVLYSRLDFVLNIAVAHDIDVLILGAFGCGVFGQDATEVAEMFKMLLTERYMNCFEKVIFAIPNGRDGNLEAFRKVYK